MNKAKRFCCVFLVIGLLVPAVSLSQSGEDPLPEGWESAEINEEYSALGMWIREFEGTVMLLDRQDDLLVLEESMRMEDGQTLETEEESLAVVDMDRERLAIMDELSRAGFLKTESGDRISISLLDGSMYFRVGQPLEEGESFDVVLDHIVLSIRGTCGMVRKDGDELSFVLASGHGAIRGDAGTGQEEAEAVEIEAGELVSVTGYSGQGELTAEKKKLDESEVPAFLVKSLQRDPEQLDRVLEETGWDRVKLMGQTLDGFMAYYREIVTQADSYRYLSVGPTNYVQNSLYYQYATVYLREGDEVPALLLSSVTREGNNMINNVKVFQYDPESGQVVEIQYDTPLSDYYGSFHTRPGAIGLLFKGFDTGEVYFIEYYTQNNRLKSKSLWTGSEGREPAAYEGDIEWIRIP